MYALAALNKGLDTLIIQYVSTSANIFKYIWNLNEENYVKQNAVALVVSIFKGTLINQ